eukprot:6005016-Pyramimonas_sp.AAC.1
MRDSGAQLVKGVDTDGTQRRGVCNDTLFTQLNWHTMHARTYAQKADQYVQTWWEIEAPTFRAQLIK